MEKDRVEHDARDHRQGQADVQHIAHYAEFLALARFLGVPDPMPGGLALAQRAKILEHIGGPSGRDQARLMRDANLGVKLTVTIPAGGNGKGVRLLVRVKNTGTAPGALLFARGVDGAQPTKPSLPRLPVIDESGALRLSVPPSSDPLELAARLPDSFGARAALRAFADPSS